MEAQTQTAECVQGASVWTQGHVCAVGTKHVKCNGGETTANNADNMRQVGQRRFYTVKEPPSDVLSAWRARMLLSSACCRATWSRRIAMGRSIRADGTRWDPLMRRQLAFDWYPIGI